MTIVHNYINTYIPTYIHTEMPSTQSGSLSLAPIISTAYYSGTSNY